MARKAEIKTAETIVSQGVSPALQNNTRRTVEVDDPLHYWFEQYVVACNFLQF